MLAWFRAIMPKEDKFFTLFGQHAAILVQGAKELDRLLQGGDTIPEACQAIVDLEHQADHITREVMQAVRRSFITPFDRSDVQALIQSMDDAIDRMNGTVKMVRLFEKPDQPIRYQLQAQIRTGLLFGREVQVSRDGEIIPGNYIPE